MAYCVVRTDNMAGTEHGKYTVTCKYYDADDEVAAIENGSIVAVGDLIEGREVRKATAPTGSEAIGKLAVVASEEIIKHKTHELLNEFINIPGALLRCYVLDTKDMFSITAEGFTNDVTTDAPVKGDVVELVADSTKLSAVASGSETGTTVVGTIYAVEGDYYVIEVA